MGIHINNKHLFTERNEVETMTKATWNFSKLDVINAASSITLQDNTGEVVRVTGIALDERPDEDGVAQQVALFKTDRGIMSTISASVLRVVPDIIDYLESEGKTEIDMKVNSGTSKQGREFITVEFIEK